VFCFRTVGAVLFDGFMKIVIGFDGALLAIIIRANNGCAGKSESTNKKNWGGKNAKSHFYSPKEFPVRLVLQRRAFAPFTSRYA
jgi:hypothetical protein